MDSKYLEILSSCPLFESISTEEVAIMLKCLKPDVRFYRKNDFITVAGEKFHGIGVVLVGSVSITKETAAGDRIILAVLNPGELFGEIVAFSDYFHWPATAIAHTKSTVAFISARGIINECEKLCLWHKKLITNLLKIVSNKALVLNRKVEYLAIKSLRARISTYLIEQYERTGNSTYMMTLNRNELADFLNVARPSLSREMCRMKEEGIIDFYRSSVKIVNLELLREQARY